MPAIDVEGTMEQSKVKAEVPCLVVTKDMWEILFLLTIKVVPINVTRGKNSEGKNESTFTFPGECQPQLDDYLLNKTIPIPDFRDFKRAMDVFKRFTR